MITLPITCKQAWIIFAVVVFLVGLYFAITFQDTKIVDNRPYFVLGLFMVGFPSAFGIGAFVYYTGCFIGNHVRCKCG